VHRFNHLLHQLEPGYMHAQALIRIAENRIAQSLPGLSSPTGDLGWMADWCVDNEPTRE